MNTRSFLTPLVEAVTRLRWPKTLGQQEFSDSNSFRSSTRSPATTGIYVSELVADYKRRSKDLGVPPELIATESIFSQSKNLLEFCRHWQNNRTVYHNSLHGTLDMLRLNVEVLEQLAEEREGG